MAEVMVPVDFAPKTEIKLHAYLTEDTQARKICLDTMVFIGVPTGQPYVLNNENIKTILCPVCGFEHKFSRRWFKFIEIDGYISKS